MSRVEVNGWVVPIVVEPDGDGFHAFCRELPGLHVAGDTQDEAIKHATDAAHLYIDSLTKHDEDIPLHAVDECSSCKARGR
jgi:predicted RNase H-like HicB family nuclease